MNREKVGSRRNAIKLPVTEIARISMEVNKSRAMLRICDLN